MRRLLVVSGQNPEFCGGGVDICLKDRSKEEGDRVEEKGEEERSETQYVPLMCYHPFIFVVLVLQTRTWWILMECLIPVVCGR